MRGEGENDWWGGEGGLLKMYFMVVKGITRYHLSISINNAISSL